MGILHALCTYAECLHDQWYCLKNIGHFVYEIDSIDSYLYIAK